MGRNRSDVYMSVGGGSFAGFGRRRTLFLASFLARLSLLLRRSSMTRRSYGARLRRQTVSYKAQSCVYEPNCPVSTFGRCGVFWASSYWSTHILLFTWAARVC